MNLRQLSGAAVLSSAASQGVQVVDAAATERLLPYRALIDAIARTLGRQIYAPARSSFETAAAQWLVMPAADDDGAICKVVRVGTAGNAASLGGAVVILDSSGWPEIIVDGAALTARRTAALTAYATDLLASRDASTLGVFGAGALALPHVEAIEVVRPLSEIRVVARTRESASALAATLRERGWVARATSASDAVREADIIVTATTAQTPVFSAGDVMPGTHINAVGAHRPGAREIPGPVFRRLRGVVVDSPETVWSEAGDLILAHDEGFLTDAQQLVDIRQVLAVTALRRSPRDVTLFKSVGHAATDLAAARLIQEMLEGLPCAD